MSKSRFNSVLSPLTISLLLALAAASAGAQELRGQRGVYEGMTADRMTVHLANGETTWLVDQSSRFANGRPAPGDWVHVEVDAYGRAVDVLIEEQPAREYATVDHTEGSMVVVRTNNGVEMWNDVPTTWHLGVAPGGLLPGDSIDVGVFRDRNLAYLRLDSRNGYAPSAPPGAVAGEAGATLQTAEAPPPLLVYDVPPCPEPDYMWTPGYWSWGAVGYYWVPGVWVAPPAPGLLWTPGYWAFVGGVYRFHGGYWGAHVGFYGGVAYGGGYYGEGFVGARWEGGHLAYNTAALAVNTTVIHNTYVNNTVVINHQPTTINNINNNIRQNRNTSFNGGSGGTAAAPSAAERQWEAEPHTQATPMQMQHVQAARANPQQQHSVNQGRPALMSSERPMVPQAAAPGAGANRAEQAPAQQFNHAPPRPAYEAPAALQEHPQAPQGRPVQEHRDERRDEGHEHEERR